MPAGEPQPIVHVSHVAVLGGGEHSLLDLVQSLDRQCFWPRVVVPANGELARRLRTTGTPVDECASLRRLYRSPHLALPQLLAVLRGGRALGLLLRRLQPALVHANATTAALFLLATPWRPACPVVWHCRDLRLPGVLGRWLARRVQCIVVPSRACQRLLQPHAGSTRVELIPNGIDTGLPLPATGQLRQELTHGAGPLVLTVGQLAPWKGHELALASFHLVRKQHPGAVLALVGDDRFGDHPGAAERLERQVRALGLHGAVRLLGYRDDVRSIMACADLLLHPAFPEPFGRVVVEAMAAGCPVVAVAGHHGPAEILRHGIDGLLVEARTAAALAAAVNQLLDAPARRRQLAAAGRRRARERYDRSLMGRRLGRLFNELLAAPSSGSRRS